PLERILDRIVLLRQHLREQLGQQRFAETTSHLRRLENLLEPLDVPADLDDALGRLAELAEAPLHLPDDPRGMVEPIPHRRLRRLDQLHALLELVSDFRAHALQLGGHTLLEATDVAPHPKREIADFASDRFLAVPSFRAYRLDLAPEQLGDGIG